MAYATAANVQDEFKSIDISTGLITSAKISEMITQIEAYIDAKISARYTVPVTAAASTPILKMVSIGMVKCRIERILAVKAPVDPNRQASEPEDCNKRWEKMLAEIACGKFPLPGADRAVSGGAWGSYTHTNDLETTFSTEEDRW